jgi:anti-sigma B factor antagonist
VSHNIHRGLAAACGNKVWLVTAAEAKTPSRRNERHREGVVLAQQQFSVSTHSHPDWELVSVGGELDLVTAPELNEALTRLDPLGRPIVVDLTAASFLDSSGISVLLKARPSGNRVTLICADGIVGRVLELVQAGQVVRIHPTLDDLSAADDESRFEPVRPLATEHRA